MFNKADILARLQDGDTADQIAKEMSDALNDAQKAYDEETKRAAEEEAKANAVSEAKREAMKEVLGSVCNYCLAAGYVDIAEDLADLAQDDKIIADLIQKIDELAELVKMIEKLEGLQFKLPKDDCKCGSASCKCKSEPKVTIKKVNPADADAIIKSFLKGI